MRMPNFAAQSGMSKRAGKAVTHGLAAIATLAMIAPSGAAMAAPDDTMNATVAVPARGDAGGPAGCYRVQGPVYGQYRMTFCLSGRGAGNYQVTGAGLSCNGGLDWYDGRNGRVEVDLYRSLCGRGQAWTGDSLSCRADAWRPTVKVPGIKVAVPVPVGPPSYNTLNCTYNPVVGGYGPIQVTVVRV